MLRWLPTRLANLYRRLAGARPYARAPRAIPDPAPEPAPTGCHRLHRLNIVQDAFCAKPRRLFRAPQAPRDITSWCDAPNAWTGRRRPRCPSCDRSRTLYLAARDGDWQAECRLHRLARRAAVRLVAERRQYRHDRRHVLAATREARARAGPQPLPPQFHLLPWFTVRPPPAARTTSRRGARSSRRCCAPTRAIS